MEVREEEPKSSFLTGLLVWEGDSFPEGPCGILLPSCWLKPVLWSLAMERITVHESDPSCLSLEAGHVSVCAQV